MMADMMHAGLVAVSFQEWGVMWIFTSHIFKKIVP